MPVRIPALEAPTLPMWAAALLLAAAFAGTLASAHAFGRGPVELPTAAVPLY